MQVSLLSCSISLSPSLLLCYSLSPLPFSTSLLPSPSHPPSLPLPLKCWKDHTCNFNGAGDSWYRRWGDWFLSRTGHLRESTTYSGPPLGGGCWPQRCWAIWTVLGQAKKIHQSRTWIIITVLCVACDYFVFLLFIRFPCSFHIDCDNNTYIVCNKQFVQVLFSWVLIKIILFRCRQCVVYNYTFCR